MSLSTLYPKVAAEWHPSKNENIKFNDMKEGSHKKCWFRCTKGHEWYTQLKSRTLQKSNCPFCCNQRVCEDNCLATLYPDITAEWHPIKNGNITPKDVAAKSNKKYWWQCSKGHVWEAILSKRIMGHGCHYCNGRKVCKENCLATINPKIAAEWHPTKNGDISPNDVISGSNKKHWFQCEKGHEWKASPNNRSRGSNCPYCSHNLLCDDNCLATCLPEIAAEWHTTKNGILTPRDIIAGSGKKYWWRCKEGHEWQSKLCNRIYNGCPRCNESKGEKKLLEIAEELLRKKFITKYIPQYKDPRIKVKRNLPFDIAIFLNNEIYVVEYQGKQHYQPINWSGVMTKKQIEYNFEKVKLTDKIKRELCKKYVIKYLAIHYKKFDEMQNIIMNYLNI